MDKPLVQIEHTTSAVYSEQGNVCTIGKTNYCEVCTKVNQTC